jgi:ribosomal protein S18 acetylase RimI-like enzyme
MPRKGELNMGCIYRDANDNDVKDRNINDHENFSDNKKPQTKKFLFECGHNPQCAIFETEYGQIEPCQYFVLDRVLVDTSKLKMPNTKIDFSSLIYFEGRTAYCDDPEVKVDLLFRLVRVCKNGMSDTVQTWRYIKKLDVEHAKFSEPFTVTFCDKLCSSCCEYRMIVEGRDFEGQFWSLRVVNPNLNATVHSLCDH